MLRYIIYIILCYDMWFIELTALCTKIKFIWTVYTCVALIILLKIVLIFLDF